MTAAITATFLLITLCFVIYRHAEICWQSQKETARAMYESALRKLDAGDDCGYAQGVVAYMLFWEARK